VDSQDPAEAISARKWSPRLSLKRLGKALSACQSAIGRWAP